MMASVVETNKGRNTQQTSKTNKCDDCKLSEDILRDRLLLYTESEYYDCTFKVGKTNPKIFKCHKLILARVSKVFARMLFGDFAEGQKSKDDAILLDEGISSEAFDSAMRFIYGNVKDFPTAYLACELYKFSVKWQIENLRSTTSLEIDKAGLEQTLMVYEMYKGLHEKDKQASCLKVIIDNTSEILNCSYWIHVTQSTVLDIISQKVLNVQSEGEIFSALVKWGQANALTPEDLRTKIDDALKQIRFMTMEAKEFAEHCEKGGDVVFNDLEKYQIFLSIGLGDSEKLPSGFSAAKISRIPQDLRKLDFLKYDRSDIYVNFDSPMSFFTFAVQREGPISLSHFKLNCLLRAENIGRRADVACCLSTADFRKILGVVKFEGIISSDMEMIKFPQPVPLAENTWYTLSISYLQRIELITKWYHYTTSDGAWTWSVNQNLDLTVIYKNPGHTDITCMYFLLAMH